MADKPPCKYGSKCYRKNPQHLMQYSHPPTVTSDSEERKRSRTPSDDATDGGSMTLPSKKPCKDVDQAPPDAAATEGNGRDVSDEDQSIDDSGDVRDVIRRKFLVTLPEDFYQFWEFCSSVNPQDPINALRDSCGLILSGPYDVLAGKLAGRSWKECVLHDRYYYDPPEMTTVLKDAANKGIHIGYYCDDPSGCDRFMVRNNESSGCVLSYTGLNIFAAIRNWLQDKLRTKALAKKDKDIFTELDRNISDKATELGLNIKDVKPSSKKRKVVAKTLNQVGISVPVDSVTDVGYRPLPMSNGELKKLLDKIATSDGKNDKIMDRLQEMITFVQFANDECDYGMGLELGLDLFCHGDYFHKQASNLLSLAYQLLGREEYGRIIQEHLKQRLKLSA